MQLSHTGTTPADTAVLYYCQLMMHLLPLVCEYCLLCPFSLLSPWQHICCTVCTWGEYYTSVSTACVCVLEGSLITLLSSPVSFFTVAAIIHPCLSGWACCYACHALRTPSQPVVEIERRLSSMLHVLWNRSYRQNVYSTLNFMCTPFKIKKTKLFYYQSWWPLFLK